jgi:alpha-glucosidase
MSSSSETLRWWQRGVLYQIYPRSFQDSNGDGVGDLSGIASRLDYVASLGVDAVWLSPIYPSPMADFGYDVSDYCAVDPLFGTLEDFARLLDETHRRGMRLIMDFVPNHTSDRHAWFEESRASRESAKRDWYIWRDPAPDGGPPNNWLANFGGSAWTLDDTTGQYYYHAFLPEQPDLNWRNPDVRAAMHDVLRFWLDHGVDGFRVDVVWHLIKDDQFRDNPPNPGYSEEQAPFHRYLPIYTTDRPEVHDVIAGMRGVLEEYDDRVLIGEIYLPVERLVEYYGEQLEGAHLPFNFQLIDSPWKANEIAGLVHEYEQALPQGGWPNWVLGNHDKHRLATRIGEQQLAVAAMLLLTLRGTPTIYYGEEIGMTDVPIPHDRAQDPLEKNLPGLGLGRDPCRTPMQWDASRHAGFTRSTPWLPVAADYAERNVEAQLERPDSLLTLYRKLIALRDAETALTAGDYAGGDAHGAVFRFTRRHGSARLLICLNLGGEPQELALRDDEAEGSILLSTRLDRQSERVRAGVALRANEGLVIKLD